MAYRIIIGYFIARIITFTKVKAARNKDTTQIIIKKILTSGCFIALLKILNGKNFIRSILNGRNVSFPNTT
jgi:hypothetical protein